MYRLHVAELREIVRLLNNRRQFRRSRCCCYCWIQTWNLHAFCYPFKCDLYAWFHCVYHLLVENLSDWGWIFEGLVFNCSVCVCAYTQTRTTNIQPLQKYSGIIFSFFFRFVSLSFFSRLRLFLLHAINVLFILSLPFHTAGISKQSLLLYLYYVCCGFFLSSHSL